MEFSKVASTVNRLVLCSSRDYSALPHQLSQVRHRKSFESNHLKVSSTFYIHSNALFSWCQVC